MFLLLFLQHLIQAIPKLYLSFQQGICVRETRKTAATLSDFKDLGNTESIPKRRKLWQLTMETRKTQMASMIQELMLMDEMVARK